MVVPVSGQFLPPLYFLKGLSYWGLQLLTDTQLAILAAAFASSARGQSCF